MGVLEQLVVEQVLHYWRAGQLPGSPRCAREFDLWRLMLDLEDLKVALPGIRLSDLLPEEAMRNAIRAIS